MKAYPPDTERFANGGPPYGLAGINGLLGRLAGAKGICTIAIGSVNAAAFREDLIVRPPHISNAAFFVQVQWQIASEHHRDAVFGRQCRGSCLRSYCNRWAYTVTDGRATTDKRVSRIGAPANIGDCNLDIQNETA